VLLFFSYILTFILTELYTCTDAIFQHFSPKFNDSTTLKMVEAGRANYTAIPNPENRHFNINGKENSAVCLIEQDRRNSGQV
jgi:hypothetical protein